MNRTRARILALVALLLIGVLQVRYLDTNDAFGRARGELIGAGDFSAFWAAFQVARAEGNPYQAEALWKIQQSLPVALDEAQRYWNPPWTLLMLSPVLSLPFETAVFAWMAANMLMLFAAGFLAWRLFAGSSIRPLHCGIAFGFFVPVWEVLSTGQLTILVTLLLLLAIWAFVTT